MSPSTSSPLPTRFTPTALREVFGAFPSGVVVLAATIDGEQIGMAASSFTSVSLDPPLVSVCVATQSRTWPQLRRAPRIGVSVLAGDHGIVLFRIHDLDAEVAPLVFPGSRYRSLAP
ncbi:MAG: flavin reductase family protein [Mycobacteriaceae bacterium]